jgi:hypothetical protein
MLRHACSSALANRGHDTRALQAYRAARRICASQESAAAVLSTVAVVS